MQNEPKNQTESQSQPVNPIERRHARFYAVQAMYQWQLAHPDLAELEAEFLQYQIRKSLDLDYFKELLHGVPAHLTELDAAMRPYLGRLFSEVDPIELAVLRIASYELLKRPDVPYRVIINEALELTKKFGSIEGFKFVNGVLDKIAKQHRAIEIQANKR